jgi:ABC-type antimicrobial peptide transport system permease subunit
MKNTLNTRILGYTAAIVSAVCMLVLGILANVGIYEEAAAAMAEWHLFFSVSLLGIIGGMIEAAIISFVIAYLFGWVYNRLVKKMDA